MTSPNTPVDVEAAEVVARGVLARIRAGELDPRPAADLLGLGFDQDEITGILEALSRLLAERREMLEALKVIAAFKRERPTGNPGSYQRGYDIGFNNAGLCAAGIAQAVIAKTEVRDASSEGKGE